MLSLLFLQDLNTLCSNVDLFLGTFITTDINLHRLDDIGTVELLQTVRHIRSQRAFSIQMPDQYVFCHFAVIDYAVKQGLISAESAMLNESESESE